MSYQPPFDGNWMTQNPRLNRYANPPSSIQIAVRFIYAGAALQALSTIVEIAAFRGNLQSVLAADSAIQLTPSQLNTVEAVGVSALVFAGIVDASLWLWMASRNKAGRRWARILSTVGFTFLTLGLAAVSFQPISVENKILPVVQWLVGFVAIVLLWQRESSDYYTARAKGY
jgi:hypothetical protein